MDEGIGLVLKITQESSQARGDMAGVRADYQKSFGDFERIGVGAMRGVQNEAANLARSIPVIGQPLAGITRALFDMGQKGTQETQRLNEAIKIFDQLSQRAFVGGTARTEELGKTFQRLGVDMEDALRRPRAQFNNLITGLSQIANEEDRLGAITEIYGTRTGAVLPIIEAKIAHLQAMTAADLEAAAANEALAASEAEVGAGAAAAGGAMALLTNPVTLVAGALVAGTAVAVGAGAAIYGLSKSAADAEDSIYELHVKTGLSVESISALDVVMREMGKDVDAVAPGLVILAKNVEAANEGQAKAKKIFDDIGVSYENNEVALRGLVKRLSEIEDPGQRAAEAVKFFGRGGAEMLKVIEQSHGDFDQFIQHLRESNELMSGESVTAAHDYELKLRELDVRWESLKRRLGDEFIPHLSKLIDTLNGAGDSATKQAGAFSFLGDMINRDIDDLRHFIEYLNAYKETGDPLSAFILAGRRSAAVENRPAPTVESTTTGTGARDEIGGEDADKVREKAERDLARLNDMGLRLLEAAKRQGEKEAEERRRQIEQQIELEKKIAADSLEALNHYYDQKNKITQINESVTLDIIKRNEEDGTFTHKQAEQERLKIERDNLQERLRQLENLKALAIARNADTKTVRDYSDAIETQKALIDKFVAESSPKLQDATKEDTENRFKNTQAIVKQYEAILKYNRELEKEQGLGKNDLPDIMPGAGQVFGGKYKTPKYDNKGGYGDPTAQAGAALGVVVKDELGPPPPGLWKQFGDTVTHALGQATSAGQIMHDSLSAAFSGLAEGAGQMFSAFLTGGDKSAAAFGKVTKAALASIASQAAVNALFQVGMALASMWLNPAEAADHWLAAATFGAVAVMAGAASLAIPAGGSGASAGAISTAVGSSGSSPSSTGPSNSQDRTINVARNNGAPNPNEPRVFVVEHQHTFSFQLEKGLAGEKIHEAVKADDAQLNEALTKWLKRDYRGYGVTYNIGQAGSNRFRKV